MKTIKLDEKDFILIKQMDRQLVDLNMRLSVLRQDYLIQENKLINSINQARNQVKLILDEFKKKYKIIGEIANIDFEKGVLILK